VVGLRAVTSIDGMTVDFYPFDIGFLGHVATRIINEVKGVNRVVYDVTSIHSRSFETQERVAAHRHARLTCRNPRRTPCATSLQSETLEKGDRSV
jgi:hypothetical protein